MSNDSRHEYAARIHRAQDFIERNLGGHLTLEDIAAIAHFSPYHFHRLYSALTGETLYRFILRLRLERAADRLLQTPDQAVTAVALDCGFSSSATFARAFRDHFGMSAGDFRRGGWRKHCKTMSKECKAPATGASYPVDCSDEIVRRFPMKTVPAQRIEVRDLPQKTLAYLRHIGPYAGDGMLFERLWGQMFAWAGPRGLFHPPESELISVYHDNPEITDEDKLRLSLGITVPPDTATSGGIALMTLPAGSYACALFELDVADYAAAWNQVMGVWLPASGWQPDDGPMYECYLNDPKQHPQGRHIVEIRINVKPL